MQDESRSALTPKFLPREVSRRRRCFVRWRSGWHREQEFMDELGRLSAFGGSEGWLTPASAGKATAHIQR